MTEFQQILDGGVGAMVFFGLYKGIDLIIGFIYNKSGKVNGSSQCPEHLNLCVKIEEIHTRQEAIMEDVTEIKRAVSSIATDVATIQGRLSG